MSDETETPPVPTGVPARGRVESKIIVVTGAASGQGLAEAAVLAAEGASVIAADIQDPLEPLPAEVRFHRLDVGDQEGWRALTARLREEHGRVDGLVNNAGVTWRARLDEVTIEDWDRVIRINTTGALMGMQELLPLMPAGGSIVNVCSRAALSGHFTAAYTASKWALRGLSRVASLELGPRGIRVNAIFPAYIDTPMVRTAPAEFKRLSLKEIPLGRPGTPADVAPLIVFLMSDESSWISGAEISVDGGEWAHNGTKVYSDALRPAPGT
jgi:3alpha(or 20beta)-hydroxysteroid dehydrogenase